MAFSENTKLAEILDNPTARACMQNHYPEMATMGPMMNMARALTLKQISAFPQAKMTQERLQKIIEDLQKI